MHCSPLGYASGTLFSVTSRTCPFNYWLRHCQSHVVTFRRRTSPSPVNVDTQRVELAVVDLGFYEEGHGEKRGRKAKSGSGVLVLGGAAFSKYQSLSMEFGIDFYAASC